MTVIHFVPDLPPEFVAYATGVTNEEPKRGSHSFVVVKKMRQYRRAYLRNLLQHDGKAAYALADFEALMREEITVYVKQKLLSYALHNWDTVIADAPNIRNWFLREHNRLQREYFDDIEHSRIPKKKLEYLLKDAIRRTISVAAREPKLLGELELACIGSTTYGIP